MKRARLVEGVIVVVVLTAVFLTVSGPETVAQLLLRANIWVYAVSVFAVIGWILASSETLYVLLRSQQAALHWGRFRLVFLAGTGIRGLVPGGSVSGPAIMAYVVATSTPVSTEGTLAMAYVAEVCYWFGSAVVAAVGLVGVSVLEGPETVPTSLVSGLVVTTAGAGVVLALGVRKPGLVERPAHWAAFAGRVTVGRVSERVRGALQADAIDRRIERFFDSLVRLSDDPRHLLPALAWSVVGWVCHSLALYVTLRALGLAGSPFVALFVVPVSGLAEGLSLFPGGLGSVESSQAVLLTLLTDAGIGTAGVVVLLFRLSSYWFRLGAGALALFYLGIRDPLLTAPDVAESE
ncbi:MAG: YbhN family protein [Haloarculaceae archaeon]